MTKEIKAMAEEQLRKFQRPNTRGTKAQAVKMNDRNVQRAINYTKHISPCGNFYLPDLVSRWEGQSATKETGNGGITPTDALRNPWYDRVK